MKFISIIIIFLFVCAYAGETVTVNIKSLPSKLSNLEKEIQNLQSFPLADCETELVKRWITVRRGKKRKRKQIVEKVYDQRVFEAKLTAFNKNDFKISIISKDHAVDLFNQLKEMKLPFAYPEDGCYARAHAMSMEMANMGLTSGKTFIEGNLKVKTKNSPKGYVEWWYHVAPILIVTENGKNIPYVFDPSIFDEPVPVSKWYKTQTSHPGGRIDRTYFTEQYNYNPFDKKDELEDYNQSDLDHSKRTIKNYLEVESYRKKKKKSPRRRR